MAIQFSCPHCGVVVKSADSAAGKKGACPQCRQPLVVPMVSAPTSAQPPDPAPIPATTPTAARSAAMAASPPAARQETRPAAVQTISEEPVPVIDPQVAPTSVSQSLKQKARRQRSRSGGWLVPALCAISFLAIVGSFFWMGQPQLKGELTAAPIEEMVLPSATLDASLSELSDAETASLLSQLNSDPAHWDSRLARMTLTGQKNGVVVEVEPGPDSQLVRVEPLKHAAFRNAVQAKSTELEKIRQRDLQAHAPDLFATWQALFAGKKKAVDLQAYRDAVGYTSLVTGVGYHLEARVEDKVYRCVAEDADGRLYFFLPRKVTAFELRGRTLAGSPGLPADYHVTLGKPLTAEDLAASQSPVDQEAAETAEKNGGQPLMNADDSEGMTGESGTDSENPEMTEDSKGNFLSQGLGIPLRDPNNPTRPKSKPKSKSTDGMEMDMEMGAGMGKKPGSTKSADGEMMDGEMMDGEMPQKPVKKATPKKKATE